MRNDSTSWPPPGYDPKRGNGYRLSLDEFLALIAVTEYRPTVAPMLRRWFGYEIVGLEANTALRAAKGVAVDAATVHQSIQGDPQKQYELYKTAQTLSQ
jgi:hypothetical protein